MENIVSDNKENAKENGADKAAKAAAAKQAKEERAKRAASEKAAREKRRIKKSDVKPDSKIKILVDANPRREGTAPHAHFAKYRNGTKVSTFLEGGGEWLHLQADIERGYIGLEG